MNFQRGLLHTLIIIIHLTVYSLVGANAGGTYPCNFMQQPSPPVDQHGNSVLSIFLEGSSTSYLPGHEYTVYVNSREKFTDLLVTGVQSSDATSHGSDFDTSNNLDYICGIIYSNVSQISTPIRRSAFTWTAPAKGTGCYSFVISAWLHEKIVYHQVFAYQICENDSQEEYGPNWSTERQSGRIILRDNFDSEVLSDIWHEESKGVQVGENCGEIQYGQAAVFCSESTLRELISIPLDLTSSSVLQFIIGSGNCESEEGSILVSLYISHLESWKTLKTVEFTAQSSEHIIDIPAWAKTSEIQVKFSQDASHSNFSTTCWALDDILILGGNPIRGFLHETLDPVDQSQWLFMPGAQIKSQCMSHGNAMIFTSGPLDERVKYAVTNDLNLSSITIQKTEVDDPDIRGGSKTNNVCGHQSGNSVVLFDQGGERRFCTTAINLRGKAAAEFILGIGSGNCSSNISPHTEIVLNSRLSGEKFTIASFSSDVFKTPTKVLIPLHGKHQAHGSVLCLEQPSNNIEGKYVWTVESFNLINQLEEPRHFMQFSINMQCQARSSFSTMEVEFSNDFGRSWHLVQEECLPEKCYGNYLTHHSIYSTDIGTWWHRVNLPLPAAALSTHTRFRWTTNKIEGKESHVALDDIFIGSDESCPNWCSGHGTCRGSTGCRCDVGYYGDSCNITSTILPTSWAVNFDDGSTPPSIFDSVLGAEIGFSCGIIATGKALVFNQKGRRMLVSKPINGLNINWLQFTILMGRHSPVGTCQPPTIAGDGVAIYYSVNQGMSWNFLALIPYDSEREPRVVSILLPPEASKEELQVRFQQSNSQQEGKGVWAIDDLLLTEELYRSIYSNAENFYRIYSTSVSFHTGVLSNSCNRTNVLLHSYQASGYTGNIQYAETQLLEATEGYILEADLILQCQDDTSNSKEKIKTGDNFDFEIELQYSKDHGITWHLLQEENLPGSTLDDKYHPASIYHASEFTQWKKVTIPVPRVAWSSNLRLRILQNGSSDALWATDNVYMGPECFMHCYNRGKCRNGKCICDVESESPTCMQQSSLLQGVNNPFNDKDQMIESGWTVIGADVMASAAGKDGCGPMPSAHYLHFYKHGVRKVVTPNLDITSGGQIQFYVRIGGGNCGRPSSRANGILLQYSIDGGVTWHMLNELYYQDYKVPTYIHRDIPKHAMTKQTMFRWWQPRNGGLYHDQWSLGDVIVGEPIVPHNNGELMKKDGKELKLNYKRSVNHPLKSMMNIFIVKSNDGNSEDFCDPRTDSLVFNKANGDRFTATDDFRLVEGDIIQFEINIGCSKTFSRNHPVQFEYSQDGGYTWELVVRVCYPAGRPSSEDDNQNLTDDLSAHDCTGVARELTEPSVYHLGDFSEWTRVVIPVTSRIAALPLRFRWIQTIPEGEFSSEDIPAAWGLRSVYIGQSCPRACHGHGKCHFTSDWNLVCLCDEGYTGEYCEATETRYAGIWDHVQSVTEFKEWWKVVQGTGEGNGCGVLHEGHSFYFNGEGTRKAETLGLDTRNTRLIQFHFKLGNSDNTSSCLAPMEKDESVVLQYSTNNGITWHLIKELNFNEYTYGEKVTLNMPYPAKTKSTSFRWIQFLRDEGQQRAEWALDEIFIGVSDSLEPGFAIDFEDKHISDNYWYAVRKGQIGSFVPCHGVADNTSESLIISDDGVAETWDFRLSSGSFLQFDLAFSCSKRATVNDLLLLEYSVNLGVDWQRVIPVCVPGSSIGCEHGLGSSYYSALNQKWTRHTVALPDSITNVAKVRFRWTKFEFTPGSFWSIDNVYLGNGCPWMCLGHGRCWPDHDGMDSCICDQDFQKVPHCEPSTVLPTSLIDTFDFPWNDEGLLMPKVANLPTPMRFLFLEKYSIIHGRQLLSTDDHGSVGIIVSRENLQMGKLGIRMLQTLPLNTEDAKYIQFHFIYPGNARQPSSSVILQSSSNNGITWKTIQVLSADRDGDGINRFVHLMLPQFAQQQDVIFRFWQANAWEASPIFKANEEVWAVENLIIGGKVSGCESHFLHDRFSRADEDLSKKWLHLHGGKVENFCDSNGLAFSASSEPGEHSLTTGDLCVSENYVLQFLIAVGCFVESSADHAVRVEFSTDGGVTWSLVRPECDDKDIDHAGCTHEIHPPSVYFPGAVPGWRRVTIELDRQHICSSVRFRWSQGFYHDEKSANLSIPWAIDDVYIGPACEQMCNGHGTCIDEGEKCLCDPGYSGPTCCDIVDENPTLFIETFDDADLVSAENWVRLSGGDNELVAQKCNSRDGAPKQHTFNVVQPGERVLESRDLDLRNAEYIQFYLGLNHESVPGAKIENKQEMTNLNGETDYSDEIGDLRPVEEAVHLQFSTDGGLRWTLLETFPFLSSNLEESEFRALHLPEASRTNATRFRFFQMMKDGKNNLGFSLDQIVLSGSVSKIDDDFTSTKSDTWLETSGATRNPKVGSTCCVKGQFNDGQSCSFMEFGNLMTGLRDCNLNYAVTNGVNVTPGSFLSFDFYMNCRHLQDFCEDIWVEYSTDLGHTWEQLVPTCLPDNPACAHVHEGSRFYSDVYPATSSPDDNNRIIIPLPEHAWSPSTRFRWGQWRDVDHGSWFIDNLYIGNECPGACNGHGRCQNGLCKCSNGWWGPSCGTPSKELPTELKAIFSSSIDTPPGKAVSPSLFSKQVGAQIDSLCGEVGFDQALHFFKACSRLLITVALNTTKADFVQFMFRTGCGASPPSTRNEGIHVEYTTNGGAVWHSLAELYDEKYSKIPGFVNILLPPQAKAIGTQFRWIQYTHTGLNKDDWALDNLLIGGKREEQMLSDDFTVKEVAPAGLWLDRDEQHMWQFYDNTEPNSFCGRKNIILAGTVPGLDVTVSTKDFLPEKGYIMQYTIVVLCQDIQIPHQPVHVQYSTDFGDTWHYLVPQCVPSDKDCFGEEVTQLSAHFVGPDWRRRTIWIPPELFGQPVRFRFHQQESDVKWALDRLFIGPACPDACSGHGDCVGVPAAEMFRTGNVDYDNRNCLCDAGYALPNCYLLSDHEHHYLKDDFNDEPEIEYWAIVEAEKFDKRCGLIVDGESLAFDGVGPRQAESEDLDLRDARFIQYNAVIGGSHQTCLPSKSRDDGVLLQYSTNGGITWKMLHSLDYLSYPKPSHDYIALPLDAKTNATRIRFWQPFTFDENTGLVNMGEHRAGWALDNVYVGGQEVNPFSLEDDFEEASRGNKTGGVADEELYEFYPNGQVTLGGCGYNSFHMTWKGGDEHSTGQSLTTRQLIVTPGHMIQFRMKVGCGEKLCSRKFPIKLEYREDPRFDNWALVKAECFPETQPAPRCPYYLYHEASIYTLEMDHAWTRITIPLNEISSGTAQFRWSQEGGATSEHSWAIDDIYVGESCENYCSGHGRCTTSLQCLCDDGYVGDDCSQPAVRYLVPVFRDNFEKGTVNTKRWELLSGGTISTGGCGPLWPYGFSRSVYFSDCGRRQLVTKELDLTRAWHINYVIQVGSINPTKECHVGGDDIYRAVPMATVVLQYSTDNGITWHTLREHRAAHYGVARRVSQALPSAAKSVTARLRWWQPSHRGAGEDQWAVDNIDIIMSRRQRYLHLLDFSSLLRSHGAHTQGGNPLLDVYRTISGPGFGRFGNNRPVIPAIQESPTPINGAK